MLKSSVLLKKRENKTFQYVSVFITNIINHKINNSYQKNLSCEIPFIKSDTANFSTQIIFNKLTTKVLFNVYYLLPQYERILFLRGSLSI